MNPLAMVHVGRKQLGLDEDSYRDLLERVTGRRSAAILSRADLGRVVAEMQRLGFTPAPPKPRPVKLDGPYAAKLQALWIAGWNLGIVRDRTDAALAAFVGRQTGLGHTRWLRHAEDARKVIEALRSWLARDGGVDWRRRKSSEPYADDVRYRIVLAQWRRLVATGAVAAAAPLIDADDRGGLEAFAAAITGKAGFGNYDGDDWIALMNALGRKLRPAPQRRLRKAAA